MVLQVNLEFVITGVGVAVWAFGGVVQNVASKPLSVIQGDVEIDDFLIILLGFNMSRSAYGSGIKFRGRGDISLIGFNDGEQS
jgi:hypothetical protein